VNRKTTDISASHLDFTDMKICTQRQTDLLSGQAEG
jgi:hypothetical protein